MVEKKSGEEGTKRQDRESDRQRKRVLQEHTQTNQTSTNQSKEKLFGMRATRPFFVASVRPEIQMAGKKGEERQRQRMRE